MEYKLSPSILSADFCNLEEGIRQTEENGAVYLHFDVMDGVFVPSISFGMPVLASIKPAVKQVIDTHLMITEPIRYVEAFAEAGADILFLCQDMRSIDLYGTVNTVICSLDSLNHLKNEEELQRVFSKVSFFMDPEGYFLFDMNTPYKHHAFLGNETYVYDMEHVFCVWQNRCHSDGRVEIQLDFFEPQVPQKGLYYRSTERFSERAYPLETVLTMLQKAGFDQVQVFDELTFDPPKPESQRLVFAAKKQGRNEISYG